MTMREVLANPSRRVFHIAPECYVIFGGTDTIDKEFFIRFGNYPTIPAVVLQKTAAIACTTTPLGDVLFELGRGTVRSKAVFIGLPQIIRRYKNLFGYSTIKAIKYESVASEKPEQGIYVHYTGKEELDVRLNNKPFFSLSARAKQDRHYRTVADNAYTVVRRMRMPHGEKQLSEQGFYMLEGGVYAYNERRVLAINPHPNFVVAHAAHGFDPAIVQSAYFSDTQSLALYRLLEHARSRQLKGAILVDQGAGKDIVQRMCSFVGYPYKHNELPKQNKVPFQKLTIGVASSQKSVKIAGPQNLIVTIDIDKRRWKASSGSVNGSDVLYDGLLYGWDLSEKCTWSELRNQFLPQSFDVGTHNIPFHQREFLTNGLRLIDSTTQKVLKNALRRIKSLQRKCIKEPSRYFMFALANINHIAFLALNERDKGSNATLKTAVAIFKSTYNSIQRSSPSRTDNDGISIFPGMRGHIVNTNDGILCVIDYQWNRDASYAQHDDELCRQIADFVSTQSAEYYADELNRLYALFDDLDGIKSSPKIKAKTESDDEPTTNDESHDVQSDKSDSHSRKRGRRARSTQRPLRSFGVVVVALLLLIGVLFGLDFFGVIDVSGTIGRWSQRIGNTTDRSGERIDDAAITEQEENNEDGQSTQSDSQQQPNDNDGDGSDSVDIEVLRSAVTDDANLTAPWLTVSSPFGAVNITVGEIITTTNLIAINSGFRGLGDDLSDGPDPDLIYPEGILRLPPDTEQYNIVLNDTMWGVAENLIIEQVKDHIGTLASINRQLNADANAVNVSSATATIEEIIALSYCADVIAIATSLLNRL